MGNCGSDSSSKQGGQQPPAPPPRATRQTSSLPKASPVLECVQPTSAPNKSDPRIAKAQREAKDHVEVLFFPDSKVLVPEPEEGGPPEEAVENSSKYSIDEEECKSYWRLLTEISEPAHIKSILLTLPSDPCDSLVQSLHMVHELSHEGTAEEQLDVRVLVGADVSFEMCQKLREQGQAQVRSISDSCMSPSRRSSAASRGSSAAAQGAPAAPKPSQLNHRFIVVNGDLVVNGSFDHTEDDILSRTSTLVYKNTAIGKRFVEEFEKIWGESVGLDESNRDVKSKFVLRYDESDQVYLFPDGKNQSSVRESCLTALVGHVASTTEKGEHKGARREVVGVLSTLHKDDCLHCFTMAALSHGVQVRLIFDELPDRSVMRTLDHAKIKYRKAPPPEVLDPRSGKSLRDVKHRFVVIDDLELITGSFDWYARGSRYNYENAVISRNGEAVKTFKAEFETLWGLASAISE